MVENYIPIKIPQLKIMRLLRLQLASWLYRPETQNIIKYWLSTGLGREGIKSHEGTINVNGDNKN